jgi:hypothetical protein
MSTVLPVLALAAGVFMWSNRRKSEDDDSESDCEDNETAKDRLVPRRRVYVENDYAQYADDPTVRKSRGVDKSLFGVVDQEERVIPLHPTDTIPIDPVGDPLWRNRRRSRMVISRDDREVVPLVQSRYIEPYAFADDSSLRADEFRQRAKDHVTEHQELRWDNVTRAPQATEWAPDPNLLLQSVAFKQNRRILGDTTIDYSFRPRRPISQPDANAMNPARKPVQPSVARRADGDVANVNSLLPARYAVQA